MNTKARKIAKPRTDLDDDSEARNLLHWVRKTDIAFSEASGVSAPALCGAWILPYAVKRGQGEAGKREVCRVCQIRYDACVRAWE